MTFASWSHDGTDVNLLLLTEEGDLSNYVNSSEWQMLSMTVSFHDRVMIPVLPYSGFASRHTAEY